MEQTIVEIHHKRNSLPKRPRGSRRDRIAIAVRTAATLLVPTVALVCCEWIHRGSLDSTFWTDNFLKHSGSYYLSWLLLVGIYLFFSHLFGRHSPAVLAVGVFSCIPAAIAKLKLDFRGEPFLPWDISQWKEAISVAGKSNLKLTVPMWWSLGIFLVLAVLGWFLRVPRKGQRPWARRLRIIGTASGAGLVLVCMAVYLSPAATQMLGIYSDMWMQNRYYRNYGVISGFLTNLQQLDIDEPEDYSEETMAQLKQEMEQLEDSHQVLWPESPAALDTAYDTPHIIYVMAEGFWDVTELEGVSFTEDPLANYHALQAESIYGRNYSPSFGGGTCDVEFEALTGFSVEPLPMGCKPFQQHVTHPMFSLPNYLSEVLGYQTKAIHCYYGKYWSRDRAYPYLGLEDFITIQDFVAPEKKRPVYWSGGLVSDDAMADMIIQQFENRQPDTPLFIHAVTMEGHSTYSEKNFPEEELVKFTAVPESLSGETVGALRDFATCMRDTDAMLGKLVEYFRQVDEPVILVFWGDHYNLVGSGYELYEETGYIEKGDTESRRLHGTPLLIWSNYQNVSLDIGTIASYNISPAVLELYGIDQPLFFQLHLSELQLMRARSRGITIQLDGTATEEMTDAQTEAFSKRWLAQYDLMFGEDYLQMNPDQE